MKPCASKPLPPASSRWTLSATIMPSPTPLLRSLLLLLLPLLLLPLLLPPAPLALAAIPLAVASISSRSGDRTATWYRGTMPFSVSSTSSESSVSASRSQVIGIPSLDKGCSSNMQNNRKGSHTIPLPPRIPTSYISRMASVSFPFLSKFLWWCLSHPRTHEKALTDMTAKSPSFLVSPPYCPVPASVLNHAASPGLKPRTILGLIAPSLLLSS